MMSRPFLTSRFLALVCVWAAIGSMGGAAAASMAQAIPGAVSVAQTTATPAADPLGGVVPLAAGGASTGALVFVVATFLRFIRDTGKDQRETIERVGEACHAHAARREEAMAVALTSATAAMLEIHKATGAQEELTRRMLATLERMDRDHAARSGG